MEIKWLSWTTHHYCDITMDPIIIAETVIQKMEILVISPLIIVLWSSFVYQNVRLSALYERVCVSKPSHQDFWWKFSKNMLRKSIFSGDIPQNVPFLPFKWVFGTTFFHFFHTFFENFHQKSWCDCFKMHTCS